VARRRAGRARGALAVLLSICATSAAAQDLDLVNVSLIDGTGAAVRRAIVVSVRGGRITRITSEPTPVSGVRRIDLGGRFLLPGFIDAHAHIETPAAARRALASGVTTARVLGDTHLSAIGTRDLIRAGHLPGPDLLVSAGHVRPRPGEAFFLTYPQFGDVLFGELRGPERIAAAVRALLDKGSDVIKVGASERAGLASTDPRKPELTEEEIRAAVAAARAAGRHVAAHAHAREGAAAAVRAGVRSIEHGTYLDAPTLQEMKRRGTFLVPTLAVMGPLADPRGTTADDIALQIRGLHMRRPLLEVVKHARALGIVVAASTDGTYDERDDSARIRVADEIALLREAGYTPLESISAATSVAARVLDVQGRTGMVQEGLEADLIVIERDPLDDVTSLFEPLLVVSDGRVVVERPW
jgi:imidazolonepropionase-like amidohydrolase